MPSINPKRYLNFHSKQDLLFNPLAAPVGISQGEVHYWQWVCRGVINDPGYGPVSSRELHPSHFVEASHTIYCLPPGCVSLQLGKCFLCRRCCGSSFISSPPLLPVLPSWKTQVGRAMVGTGSDGANWAPGALPAPWWWWWCRGVCIHPRESIHITALKSI